MSFCVGSDDFFLANQRGDLLAFTSACGSSSFTLIFLITINLLRHEFERKKLNILRDFSSFLSTYFLYIKLIIL
jgi:hypothetical protein